MHEADERPAQPLPIDPQPRRDLEVPPMVSAPKSEGVASVKSPEGKPRETSNIFAGLDFNSNH